MKATAYTPQGTKIIDLDPEMMLVDVLDYIKEQAGAVQTIVLEVPGWRDPVLMRLVLAGCAPAGAVVIPPEVLDLLRFMCATWTEVDRFVYQHCDGDALMRYPVVQGTSNQINLHRIGEQNYDSANIQKAVKWLLNDAV